jgi:hypothetical protein
VTRTRAVLLGAVFGGILAPVVASIFYVVEMIPLTEESISLRDLLVAIPALLKINDMLTRMFCGLSVGIPGAVWLHRLEPRSTHWRRLPPCSECCPIGNFRSITIPTDRRYRTR